MAVDILNFAHHRSPPRQDKATDVKLFLLNDQDIDQVVGDIATGFQA
jgi:hypothetical protein